MSYTLDETVCSKPHIGSLELDPLTGVPISHLPLPSEAVGREARSYRPDKFYGVVEQAASEVGDRDITKMHGPSSRSQYVNFISTALDDWILVRRGTKGSKTLVKGPKARTNTMVS